jgi:transposase
MPSHPSLPDDIEALKALLRQRDGEVQQLRETVSTLGRP